MQLNWLGAETELAPPALPRMTNCQPRRVDTRLRPSRDWLAGGLALLRLWRQRLRQRAELARLSECDRHDLGVSQADVWAETEKWFWQA